MLPAVFQSHQVAIRKASAASGGRQDSNCIRWPSGKFLLHLVAAAGGLRCGFVLRRIPAQPGRRGGRKTKAGSAFVRQAQSGARTRSLFVRRVFASFSYRVRIGFGMDWWSGTVTVVVFPCRTGRAAVSCRATRASGNSQFRAARGRLEGSPGTDRSVQTGVSGLLCLCEIDLDQCSELI